MNENCCPTRTDDPQETPTVRPLRPRVDVHETDTEVRIRADMPGTDEDSIEITLEDRVLVLRGTPEAGTRPGLENRWTEFQLAPYERRFALRDDLDREGIRASVKDGVVEVLIPQRSEEKRSIPITSR